MPSAGRCWKATRGRWSPPAWSSPSRLPDRPPARPAGRGQFVCLHHRRPAEVASLELEDWERIRQLVTTYASLRLGGTDASVITLAERHSTTRIATLNHRDFTVVRPRHAAAFELLP